MKWALYYAALGYEVFPVPPGTKAGYSDLKEEITGRPWGASKDANIVRSMFEAHPDAWIGARTGEVSGFIAFDIDTLTGHKYDGFASLKKLEAQHGELPPTQTSESPSGSRHLIFDHPGFHVPCSVGTDKKGLAPGIDVKGDGGMIVMPPSGTSEKGYRKWIKPPDSPRAKLPAWTIDWFRAQGSKKTYSTEVGTVRTAPTGHRPPDGSQAARMLKTACEAVAAAEGARNTELNNQALIVGKYVGNGEIAEDVAIHDLLAACEDNGLLKDDGKSQCIATIRSGMAAGRKSPAQTADEMFSDAVPTVSASSGAMPMMGGQKVICELGGQILATFNQAHPVVHATDLPQFPIVFDSPLRGPLIEAIGKMVSLAEMQRAALKFDVIGDVLGVLALAHNDTLAPVVARIRQTGAIVPDHRVKRAEAAFEAQVNRELRTGQGWRLNEKGNAPDPDISENVDVLLDHLHAEVRYNAWARVPEYRRGDATWRPLTDDAIKAIWMEARSEHVRYKVTTSFLSDALTAIAHRTEVDPALDRINSLVWDGKPRLDTWLHKATGCPDDAYHSAVSRNVAGGIVKRLRHPGAKHDETLILIGEQGTNKSTVARILSLRKEWHCDNLDVNLPVRELAPAMAAKVIIEFAEIDKYSRKDAAKIKSFITTVNDSGTMKFNRFATDHYRRCIVVCTTNSPKPLKDESGNRRFLPVIVKRMIDEVWLRENVDQILAEAAHCEAAGEGFGIPSELWAVADQHQEAVRDFTPEEDAVQSWFGSDIADSSEARWLWSSDLAAAFRHQRMNDRAKIGRVMASMGYKTDRCTVGNRRDRCWFKGAPTACGRQWLPNLEQGRGIATWSLLPSPAQMRANEMRSYRSMPKPIPRTSA